MVSFNDPRPRIDFTVDECNALGTTLLKLKRERPGALPLAFMSLINSSMQKLIEYDALTFDDEERAASLVRVTNFLRSGL